MIPGKAKKETPQGSGRQVAGEPRTIRVTVEISPEAAQVLGRIKDLGQIRGTMIPKSKSVEMGVELLVKEIRERGFDAIFPRPKAKT